MKLLFFGDSITDAGRNRESDGSIYSYGTGFVRVIADRLLQDVGKYEILNRGISGNRSVDLYARIKKDVWNENPDVVTVLVGVNDIYHELKYGNGVDAARYGKIMRAIVGETLALSSGVKIVLCEPFVLRGSETEAYGFDEMNSIRDYARELRSVAAEYSLPFVPLQERLCAAAEAFGAEAVLSDGIHPTVVGARIIADAWLETFGKI